MSNERTSCTTTGLRVGDNEFSRTPILEPVADDPSALGVIPEPGTGDAGRLASPFPERPMQADKGIVCTSQVTVGPIKPVDAKQWGSNPGDHRTNGARIDMDFAVNPPAPREQMRGQRDSRNYDENGKAFKSTEAIGDPDADI